MTSLITQARDIAEMSDAVTEDRRTFQEALAELKTVGRMTCSDADALAEAVAIELAFGDWK